MDFTEVLYTRRSVRGYSSEQIDYDTVKELVRSAQQAPSACNKQGWRFIFIDDKNLLQKIRNKGGASFLGDVPNAILVIYDNRTDNLEYMDYIQSASAAIENMVLSAHSLG
ncbi:MAG: nitroreductase family protein, partial [Candidatus Margulisiibacteriota bacterium]